MPAPFRTKNGGGCCDLSGLSNYSCVWLAKHKDKKVLHRLIVEAIDIYRYILFGSIIASWVAPGSQHPIVRFLYRVTEPVLAPIRKVMPDLGGIDLSPIVVLIGLSFLKGLV